MKAYQKDAMPTSDIYLVTVLKICYIIENKVSHQYVNKEIQ